MNREEAQNLLNNSRPKGNNAYSIMLNEALNMAIKALEQEPCDTCGYEEGSIYCKEHCPHEAKIEQEPKTDSWSIKDVADTFKKHGLIRVQEPSEDAIDRAEAIKIASGYCHPANVAKELAKLPPVNPQPKTGYWIEHPHEAGENWEYSKYECSKCHVWEDNDSDFCPNCGCRMVEPQERSDKE